MGRTKKPGNWKGETVSRLRALIEKSDPAAVEEVKWKKPTNPKGVPVWSHDGIICTVGTLKNAVRLTFFKGAKLEDPKKALQREPRRQRVTRHRLPPRRQSR